MKRTRVRKDRTLEQTRRQARVTVESSYVASAEGGRMLAIPTGGDWQDSATRSIVDRTRDRWDRCR